MAWPSSCSATACQETAPRSGRRSVRSKAMTAARMAATLLPSALRTPNQAVRVMASTPFGWPLSRSLELSVQPSTTGG